MKKKLVLPNFKNEDEERDFWDKIDLSEYYEPEDLAPVYFPNLRPTTKPISIRIPEYLLTVIKESANKQDVPYQALIKETLYEKYIGNNNAFVGYLNDIAKEKRKTKGQRQKKTNFETKTA